jgi:YD repeat-containing protein
MWGLGRTKRGRARWLAAFTLLLLASTAVPVLAESPKMGLGPAQVAEAPPPAAESPPSPESPAPPAEERPPEPRDVGEAVEMAESEEIAKDEWLEGPEAIRQREESRTAFDDLASAEAEGLLSKAFPELLAQLDGDPARVLSDLQIEEIMGDHGALVPDGEGGSQLVESPIPIRSQVPGEEAKPVDLSLKEAEGGFVSEVPATDIRLPASLGGEVEIGSELAISSLPGDGEVTATRFGDKDLFLGNTDTNTDTFIAPLARSVEVFEQLRSPKSPEQFRFGLSLPKGATLRLDGQGGAEVVDSSERRIAFVPAPYAVDAQGTDVPVSMGVDGESLVVGIAHRSLDTAYPILLDPELVTEEWYWSGGTTFGLAYWGWQETADYENSTSCFVTCWGTGLYARSKGSNYWYGPNTWGRWVYTAPNSTAFIKRAVFWTLRGSVYNCPTNQPHGWLGLWNGSSYSGLGVYSPLSFSATSWDTGSVGAVGTRQAHVAIGTAGAASQLACGHDFYVGGATIYQDDPENPAVDYVTGMPGGWITDTPAFTLTTRGSDPGLGVRKITLTRDGQPTIERPVGCNGTASNRCPTTRSEEFNLSGLSFEEGKKSASITVEDATGRKSSPYSWNTYVDRTKPDLTLSGQLAVATNEGGNEEHPPGEGDELSLPVYNLQIKATDGSSSPDSAKRSGVKRIEVLLDGAKLQEWEQPCPGSSCSMEKIYALKLNNITSAGEHKLEVIATDYVNKKRERVIEFEYIPATGMKDEYVMHYFPLPDGQGNESEEEHPERPELAVNVMNGNLVYRERDVEVEGYSVDLEVERYYNSLLPEEENTEWGEGWTLAQTPDLEPEETESSEPPEEALMVRTSGAVEGSVELPASANEEVFDPELQAVVTKEPGGGYEVADETGETDTAIAFDEGGQVEELRTEGHAKVDYAYEGDALSEIAVSDPAATDSTPDEVAEQEELEDVTPAFKYSFGTQGSGNGQFKVPTDLAIDPTDESIWVADDGNNRVQHFSAVGEYLGQFASCNDPTAVEIDSAGDVYVACAETHLINKYNDKGELLKKLAEGGSGNGQVKLPLDLALDSQGDLWVADSENDRLQEFDSAGKFIRSISLGAANRPWGIDVAPNGDIWVTEPVWFDRVSVYDQNGQLLRRIGSKGTGHSQFNFPADVEVDALGYAWVTDARNDRVQVFDQEGAYVTEFGQAGKGEGQLDTDWWLRIAMGDNGDVWLTDQGNARLQRWRAPSALMADYGAPIQEDPKVEVDVSGGLVESVEGEEAGQHTYEHDDGLLTAYEGPQGETEYGYDEAQRLTKVTLPNGTWAEIEYGSTDGRVKSVTVAPNGSNAKTTYFSYTDEPRRSTVTPPDAPAITYDIGDDGSVFKWWNALKPPEFEDIAGTLYDVENKETAAPIAVGDYNLSVQAYSEEGVASIQVFANGRDLISEKTCPQVYEEPAKCKKLADEWVTYTGNHAPGILNLEIVIEDRIKQVASERFWVNIPYTPPPLPDEPVKPAFASVLEFREEHGLDLDLDPVEDEFELNDRVFDTINDWIQGKPVAEASMERWGAPLRSREVGELEWRIAYQAQAASAITAWANAHPSSGYAGYVIDEAAGGLVRVGFTNSQASQVADLKATAGLAAPMRVTGFSVLPTNSLSQLESLAAQVEAFAVSHPELPIATTGTDMKANRVSVGAGNVAQVTNSLTAMFGAGAPISVSYAPMPGPRAGRERIYGPIRAGDRFAGDDHWEGFFCTANFGAWDKGVKPGNGQPVTRYFMLAAGHCVYPEEIQRRRNNPIDDKTQRFGYTARRGYDGNPSTFDTDAAAVRIEGDARHLTPRYIYLPDYPEVSVRRAVPPQVGMWVCQSGVTSDERRCGRITKLAVAIKYEGQRMLQVEYDALTEGGDSGAPIWQMGTNNAVGILTAGSEGPEGEELKPGYFTPLLPIIPMVPGQPGVFGDPDLAPLNLFTVD